MRAMDGVGLLFERDMHATGQMRIVLFVVGVVLMLFCVGLLWLLILRLHQPFGDFLRGSSAVLMQVEILVIGVLACRDAHRLHTQQQKKEEAGVERVDTSPYNAGPSPLVMKAE